ncbi:Retrovirus-related Pol poly [Paramuricea clavata]|uniref:Retrovirus-related Pol poly n=1 Tax=Paramuricea clavata TaxID=317549 RepID=A0A7D9EM22_PARCT|nr:Retrovirus-related Pol poly [Paramuricea clavata]
MNHFAKVCKSSQNRDQNKFPRQPRSSRQFNNSSINTVNRQHTDDESNSSSEDEYIYMVNTSSVVASKDNLTSKLKINRTNFRALIDTGASINIIDEPTFQHLCKQRPIKIHRSKARIYAYAAQSLLPMLGVFEEIIESKTKMTTAKFHVAKGDNGNLLCSETAKQLQK